MVKIFKNGQDSAGRNSTGGVVGLLCCTIALHPSIARITGQYPVVQEQIDTEPVELTEQQKLLEKK